MRTITYTLKTPDEVVNEVSERLSAASLTVEKKGTWVWLRGTEKGDTATISILKDIGFKWSAKRKEWYHTCETDPTKIGRGYNRNRKQPTSQPKGTVERIAKTKYQPSRNIEEEFAKRFGLA